MKSEQKKLVFISHAVPSDDYLAVWLASKLRLLGYEVWVDKDDLRSGSAFWNEIELKMRNESIKFISLISKDYINKALNRDTGVFLEVTLAKTLSKSIDNYIIPIKVDDCDYDDFPINILPLDTIDFSSNWGTGLKKLLKELEMQDISKNKVDSNVLSLWHEFQGIQGEVVEQRETYGSNWIKTTLPEKISIYKFFGKPDVVRKHIPYGCIRNEDYFLGFFDDSGLDVRVEFKEVVLVEDFLFSDEYILNTGDIIKDTEPKFTSLMNKALYDYFYSHEDFKAYPIANNRKVVYPVNTHSNSGYVSFKHRGKKGRRTLTGNRPVRWRYGVSFYFQLYPFPHYVANHHLLSSGNEGFFDSDKQQEYRRSITSEWYNRHWFERLLAFLTLASGISRDATEFDFVCGREKITLNIETVSFYSNAGYAET